MNLTPDQESRIRLLSDDQLYTDAITFAGQHQLPDATQLNGLLSYSQSFAEIDRFVRHQESRDWQGSKSHYKPFYEALKKQIQQVRADAVRTFVSPGLTKAEANKATEYYASLLVQEFIQHLVAEALFRQA